MLGPPETHHVVLGELLRVGRLLIGTVSSTQGVAYGGCFLNIYPINKRCFFLGRVGGLSPGEVDEDLLGCDSSLSGSVLVFKVRHSQPEGPVS